MSNWISITKADLYNSKAAALIDTADAASLGAGQVDRTTGVIADVTLEIRRRVARENIIDQDATKIPGGLRPLAVDLIFCRLKVALEMNLTDDERHIVERREKELERIEEGRSVIEPPDNPMSVGPEQTIPEPSFGRRHHEFTARSQDG